MLAKKFINVLIVGLDPQELHKYQQILIWKVAKFLNNRLYMTVRLLEISE